MRYYVNLLAWTKAWFLKSSLNNDATNPVDEYYNQIVQGEKPHGNVLQRLMFCGSDRWSARQGLNHPDRLKPLREINPRTPHDTENFKLNRLAEGPLLLSKTDRELAKSYFAELCRLYPTDEELWLELPTWLRPEYR